MSVFIVKFQVFSCSQNHILGWTELCGVAVCDFLCLEKGRFLGVDLFSSVFYRLPKINSEEWISCFGVLLLKFLSPVSLPFSWPLAWSLTRVAWLQAWQVLFCVPRKKLGGPFEFPVQWCLTLAEAAHSTLAVLFCFLCWWVTLPMTSGESRCCCGFQGWQLEGETLQAFFHMSLNASVFSDVSWQPTNVS